jgi:sugar transferase (PEP-CTERM system associated)
MSIRIQVFNHDIALSSLVLMSLESGIAVLSILGVAFYSGEPVPGWRTCIFFAVIVVFAAMAMGLYNMRLRTHLFGLGLRLALTASLAMIAVLAGIAAFPVSRLTVGVYANALIVTVALWFLLRFLLGVLFKDGYLRSRVLVYGAGKQAEFITRLRRRTDRLGFTIVGFLPSGNGPYSVPQEQIVDCGSDLLQYCELHQVDEIVVAIDDRRCAFPVNELLHCRINGVHVLDIVDFLERETSALRVELLRPSSMIFSPGFQRSRVQSLFDRFLDMAISLMLLVVSWPVILLATVAIKLEDGLRAPVLYRQIRVGKDGRTFTVLKLRSMKVDAEADGVARWASPKDIRVTRVGAMIRPTRIDELPQLWNVLRGDMRFVGPRPERPEFVVNLTRNLPFYSERHSVPPGLTGWAQLRYMYGASEQDAIEKLKYDLYYVKNRSFVFDLVILIQTVEVILFGRGAR